MIGAIWTGFFLAVVLSLVIALLLIAVFVKLPARLDAIEERIDRLEREAIHSKENTGG